MIKRIVTSLGGTDESLGMQLLQNHNEGLLQFLNDLRPVLNNRLIIFNGIGRGLWRENRDLRVFDNGGDIALNELFCYEKKNNDFYSKDELLEDIELMLSDNKAFIQQTNIPNKPTETERKHIQRFCFGNFLLGYRPGYTFFKYAEDPNYLVAGNIKDNSGISMIPEEVYSNLGNPISDYENYNSFYRREFEKGIVYVNMEDNQLSLTLDKPYILMDGTIYSKDETISIPSKDAIFLFKNFCGNAKCDDDENSNNCPQDCIDCIHPAEIEPCDGCIGNNEIFNYISEWKSETITITNLVDALKIWKEC